MASEFKVEITQEGSGPNCPVGSTATVHYTGKLTNGKVFAYRDTWGCDVPFVRFASSTAEAVQLATELLASLPPQDAHPS